MMKRNAPWTIDDDIRLLELHRTGRPLFSIAAAFKRSKSAIAARLSILRRRARQATAQMQTDEQ